MRKDLSGLLRIQSKESLCDNVQSDSVGAGYDDFELDANDGSVLLRRHLQDNEMVQPITLVVKVKHKIIVTIFHSICTQSSIICF